MKTIQLKIITPRKIVREEEIKAVTLPAADGEITILPRHTKLLTLLKEGIVNIHREKSEEALAIGGGYAEVDGKSVTILVSAAYGQDEINEKLTTEAIERAKRIIVESKDQKEIHNATLLLRRSLVELKLLKRHPRRHTIS